MQVRDENKQISSAQNASIQIQSDSMKVVLASASLSPEALVTIETFCQTLHISLTLPNLLKDFLRL